MSTTAGATLWRTVNRIVALVLMPGKAVAPPSDRPELHDAVDAVSEVVDDVDLLDRHVVLRPVDDEDVRERVAEVEDRDRRRRGVPFAIVFEAAKKMLA